MIFVDEYSVYASSLYNIKQTPTIFFKLHGYTVHQQYWTLFYYQLMHITLKNAELLKHSKLDKNSPFYLI